MVGGGGSHKSSSKETILTVTSNMQTRAADSSYRYVYFRTDGFMHCLQRKIFSTRNKNK